MAFMGIIPADSFEMPSTAAVFSWDLCPRTVILDEGRLVADGPTTELLQDQALMERHGLEVPYSHVPFTTPPSGDGRR